MNGPITIENQIKLQKNWEAICNDLKVTDISPALITGGVITSKERDDLLKERTLRKQNEQLLSILLAKDDQHFESFGVCLFEGYHWLAKGLADYTVTAEDREAYKASILQDCTLPDQPVCFEGRATDVEKISRDFISGCRLAVIQAFGGQGKTALATVIGHEFVSRWGIRSVMADLRYVSNKEDVVKNILFALKSSVNSIINYGYAKGHKFEQMFHSAADVETEDTRLRELLRKAFQEISAYGRKILLILDNCDTALTDDVQDEFKSLLKDINVNCRNTYVLCTSRYAIHLPNVQVKLHQLESLPENAALSLLRWYSPSLDSADGVKLARKCGFMALLLHLFGTLLRRPDLTAADLLTELDAKEMSLFALSAGPFDPQACINITYKRLPPTERALFQLLSFFPSYFSANEAFALSSRELKSITKLQHHQLIGVLCDMSLITFDESRQLFVMHSVIQDFATYKTSREDRERFIKHFMSLMEPNITCLDAENIQNCAALFEKQNNNFVKYIDYFTILSNESKEALLPSMQLLAKMLFRICEYAHVITCLKALLNTNFGDTRIAVVAKLYTQKAIAHGAMDEMRAAMEDFLKVIDICENMEEPYDYKRYCGCIQAVGLIQYFQQNYLKALQSMEKCLEVTSANNDETLSEQTRMLIALIKTKEGDADGDTMIRDIYDCSTAAGTKDSSMDRHPLLEMLYFARLIGHRHALYIFWRSFGAGEYGLPKHFDTALLLEQIGIYMIDMVGSEGAVDILKEALAMKLETFGEFHRETAQTMHELARAMSAHGNHAEAFNTYQRALRIKEQVLGESPSAAMTQKYLGYEMIELGNADGAVEVLKSALAMEEKTLGEYQEETKGTLCMLSCALLEQKNYTEALCALTRVLRIEEQVCGESRLMAIVLHKIGRKLIQLNKTDDAETVLRRALTMMENMHEENHEDTGDMMHELARAISAQGNHAEALGTYQKALRIREQVMGETENTARTLCCIGVEMMELGNADGAMDVLRRAHAMMEKILGEHHEETTVTLCLLARAMSKQGNHQDALTAFQKAFNIQEHALGDWHISATTLHFIGHEMMELDNADGAANAFRRSMAITEKSLGENHKETADAVDMLAYAISAQGNHKEALSTYQRALHIKEQVMGECCSTASTLHNMGVEMLELDDADGAVNVLRRAMTIKEQELGECHAETAVTMCYLAQAISLQGNHEESLSTYQSALSIQEQVTCESHVIACTLHCIALEMKELGNVNDAVDVLRRALSIRERVRGEYHKETADTLHLLAFAMGSQGNHTEALSIFQRTFRIRERVLGESIETADTLHCLGRAMIALDNIEGAVDVLKKALSMVIKTLGEHHKETADILSVIAYGMAKQGKHEEALSTYQRCLRIEEQVVGEGSDTASTLYSIAVEMQELGYSNDAVNVLRRTLDMREKALGENNELTLKTICDLAVCISLQGNHAEALSAFQKALRTQVQVLGECLDTANTLQHIGNEMIRMDNADDAVNVLRRALAMREKILGEYHEEIAVAIYLLARALSAQGNHTEALSTYQRALGIQEQVLGESIMTANTLHKIGEQMSKLGNPAGAAGVLRRSLAMRKKIVRKDDEETSVTLFLLACTMTSQKKHTEALSTYKKALRIQEKMLGECNSTAKTLHWIGESMYMLGQIDGAESYLRRSLAMKEKVLGHGDPSTAVTLFVLACAISAQGRHAEAFSTYQKARHIGEQVLGQCCSASTAQYGH